MSDTHMQELAWTDCPDCGNGQEHAFYIYGDMPDPIIMDCVMCGHLSRHRLRKAFARWGEVEEANYRDRMWYSAD